MQSCLGSMDTATWRCKMPRLSLHRHWQCGLQPSHGDCHLRVANAHSHGPESRAGQKDSSHVSLWLGQHVSLDSAIKCKILPRITDPRSIIVIAGLRIRTLGSLGSFTDTTCMNPFPPVQTAVQEGKAHSKNKAILPFVSEQVAAAMDRLDLKSS